MKQREELLNVLIEFCNDRGNRTFSLKELNDQYQNYDVINIGGDTPQATVRRLLQELRDQKLISFLDQSGHYTLRGILLDTERRDIENLDITRETPDKQEYLVEVYARNSKWVQLAKETYGSFCMIDACRNTFKTVHQKPYIEVHHIIPLHMGGEDGVWNLSVLCAHHHKMAHFSQQEQVDEIQKCLLSKVERYG